ncbi:DUF542 domain-containing protein [Candidatus Laterigemmans baculatus]|uniref:DUF542 domain-containing protein n=1 Tax=Candidatus Laterigemmans baculatus TaxID=2770505 RepID=UPI0013DA9C45|nr:DUF542 domain-containing protein [Candidatus Laterigemmans baculatus]
MNDLDLHSNIIDWCIEHPESLSLFERLGIDYCCGGKSLAYACEQRELDPEAVLIELQRVIASGEQTDAS